MTASLHQTGFHYALRLESGTTSVHHEQMRRTIMVIRSSADGGGLARSDEGKVILRTYVPRRARLGKEARVVGLRASHAGSIRH